MRLGITWRGVARFGGRVPFGYVTVWSGKSVLVRRGAVRYRVVGSGRARHGGRGNVRQGTAWLARLGGHGRARSDRG